MAVVNQILHRKNSSGSYDTVYLKANMANVTGTLPVANGGTGATTAADARTNLGIVNYTHPSTKQCNYSYTHPTEKQCNIPFIHAETYTGDLNNLKTVGFYRVNAGQPNLPTGLEWSQIVVLYDGTSDTFAQIGVGFSSGDIYYRGASSAGGWTNWKHAQNTLVSGTNIKTINNNSILGSGNLSVSGLPSVTTADNGKILKVVNGSWELYTLPEVIAHSFSLSTSGSPTIIDNYTYNFPYTPAKITVAYTGEFRYYEKGGSRDYGCSGTLTDIVPGESKSFTGGISGCAESTFTVSTIATSITCSVSPRSAGTRNMTIEGVNAGVITIYPN